MHELSIAGAILDASLRHATGRRLVRVHVRIGHLRQVVADALAFAWQMITPHTAAEGAELELEEVQAEVRCRICGEDSVQAGFPLVCAACGTIAVDVIRGEELEIAWLEVEEPEPLAIAKDRSVSAAGIDEGESE